MIAWLALALARPNRSGSNDGASGCCVVQRASLTRQPSHEMSSLVPLSGCWWGCAGLCDELCLRIENGMFLRLRVVDAYQKESVYCIEVGVYGSFQKTIIDVDAADMAYTLAQRG